jgi:hypothetical protein
MPFLPVLSILFLHGVYAEYNKSQSYCLLFNPIVHFSKSLLYLVLHYYLSCRFLFKLPEKKGKTLEEIGKM